jgi:hypothetical protein
MKEVSPQSRRWIGAALLLASLRLVAPGLCLMSPSASLGPHACCETGLRSPDPPCCSPSDPAERTAHVWLPSAPVLSQAAFDLDALRVVAGSPTLPSTDNTHSPPRPAILRI